MGCLCCGKKMCEKVLEPTQEPLLEEKPAGGNPWAKDRPVPVTPPAPKKATTLLESIARMTQEAAELEADGKGADHLRIAITTLQNSSLPKDTPFKTSEIFKSPDEGKKGCCVM